jgi:peroxiredoxin
MNSDAVARGAAALLLGLLAFATRAEVDILDYTLRDLATSSDVSLADFRGRLSILMFFEPDCPYCFRQARALDALLATCPDIQPIAIGVNGDRAALQKEMRRMRAEFPVLQIDAHFQADLGKVVATPLLLLSDRNGMLVTHLRGLQSEDVLRDLISRIDPAACERSE